MGKKDKKKISAPPPAPPVVSLYDARARRWFKIGAGCLVFGFLGLLATDTMGGNPASWLSPALIVGGYASIALGLFLPPAPPPSETIKPVLPA